MKPPKFTLSFLYKQILKKIEEAETWDWPEVAQVRADKYKEADTLLELLEHLTVFHIGLGKTVTTHKFKDRVSSFNYLSK